MRNSILAAILLCAGAAFADDTKPPAISDVKASVRGGTVTVEARITDETGVLSAICHHRSRSGKVEDSPMVKNDYDDTFKVSFPGGGDTEYWIESSDLLGNGPSNYGTASKPMAASGKAGGKTAVAQAEPKKVEPAAEEPKERKRRERPPREEPKQEEAKEEPPR